VKLALGNRGLLHFFRRIVRPVLVFLVTGCSSSSFTPPLDTLVPSAPSGLTSTVVSATQINLAWTASTTTLA